MAGHAAPAAAEVNPGIGEPPAAFPKFTFVDAFFVIGASYDHRGSVWVERHIARLQNIRAVALVFHRRDDLGLVVERAFGHGHHETVGQQQLDGVPIIVQLCLIPGVLHGDDLRRVLGYGARRSRQKQASGYDA